MGRRLTLNERRLTTKEVKQLLAEGAVLNSNVTNHYREQSLSFDVYDLPDGNYLFLWKEIGLKGKGDIWPKEYVNKEVEKIIKEKSRPHLKGLSNVEHWYYFSATKETFPENILKLVDDLFIKVNLPTSAQDFSYDSLDIISKKLNELGEDFVETNLYDNIVAYLGEILIRKINGKWGFYTPNDLRINPKIITSHKWVSCDPIAPIWYDLLDVTGFNLRKNLVSEIRSHQLERNIYLK